MTCDQAIRIVLNEVTHNLSQSNQRLERAVGYLDGWTGRKTRLNEEGATKIYWKWYWVGVEARKFSRLP